MDTKKIKKLMHEIDGGDTESHCIRVGNYMAMLAEDMGMSPQTQEIYREAGRLHDIGKITIAETIKNPADFSKMSPQEKSSYREEIKKHVKSAGMFLKELDGCRQEYLDAANFHHCWHNGSTDGYSGSRELPAEGQMPLVAQVCAVCDVYEALSANRSYKKGWPEEKIRAVMDEDCQKGKYNPEIYDIFVHKTLPRIKQAGQEEAMRDSAFKKRLSHEGLEALDMFGGNITAMPARRQAVSMGLH